MSVKYDDGIPYGEQCPTCTGTATNFDPAFGIWKCEDCSTVWGHDEDDPDYDEPDYEVCPHCMARGTVCVVSDDVDRAIDILCPHCDGSGYIISATTN